MVRKQAALGLLLGMLLSGVCLWYAFRGVSLSVLAHNVGRVGAGWVAASVAGCFFSLVLRAARWRLLLHGGSGIGFWSLLSSTFIGMMANNVLPARLGEGVRAWVLARREQAPVVTVLASIVVERLFDVVALVGILGLALVVSPPMAGGNASAFHHAGIVGFLLSTAGVVALLITIRYQSPILRMTECWMTQPRHAWTLRGIDLCRRFLEGLWVPRGRMQTAVTVGLSFGIWALGIVSFYVLAQGFGLALTLVQVTLVFAIVLFGIAIPSAPGFVGTFHGFCVAGLAMVAGTEPTLAAAYATLLHGSQWLAINGVGVAFLLADRSVTWASIASLSRQG